MYSFPLVSVNRSDMHYGSYYTFFLLCIIMTDFSFCFSLSYTVIYISNTRLLLFLLQFCCSWNGADECTSKNSWWLPTPILSSSSSSVTLDGTVCGSGQFITALRYAWRESPCVFKRCAVYSQANNLPAPPFVTVKPRGSGTAFTYDIDWSKPQLIPQ